MDERDQKNFAAALITLNKLYTEELKKVEQAKRVPAQRLRELQRFRDALNVLTDVLTRVSSCASG